MMALSSLTLHSRILILLLSLNFTFSSFKPKTTPSMWTIAFNHISLMIVEILVLSKSWFLVRIPTFLVFVKSVTRKLLGSVLGLNFLISAPLCRDGSLEILTRRSRFLGENLT